MKTFQATEQSSMKLPGYVKDFLGKPVLVEIDRPLNARHPKHGFTYEVNYGFVPGTKAPEGEEVDPYVLGVDRPLDKMQGVCITAIHRLNDDDDKLVVVPDAVTLADTKIIKQTKFQEKFFKAVVVRQA